MVANYQGYPSPSFGVGTCRRHRHRHRHHRHDLCHLWGGSTVMSTPLPLQRCRVLTFPSYGLVVFGKDVRPTRVFYFQRHLLSSLKGYV